MKAKTAICFLASVVSPSISQSRSVGELYSAGVRVETLSNDRQWREGEMEGTERERGNDRSRYRERGERRAMLVTNGGTKIPRLYQCLSPMVVPGFPDCTNACHKWWYQDSPIVPMLVTNGGTRIPRLYQYLSPMVVPGFPECTIVSPCSI